MISMKNNAKLSENGATVVIDSGQKILCSKAPRRLMTITSLRKWINVIEANLEEVRYWRRARGRKISFVSMTAISNTFSYMIFNVFAYLQPIVVASDAFLCSHSDKIIHCHERIPKWNFEHSEERHIFNKNSLWGLFVQIWNIAYYPLSGIYQHLQSGEDVWYPTTLFSNFLLPLIF